MEQTEHTNEFNMTTYIYCTTLNMEGRGWSEGGKRMERGMEGGRKEGGGKRDGRGKRKEGMEEGKSAIVL